MFSQFRKCNSFAFSSLNSRSFQRFLLFNLPVSNTSLKKSNVFAEEQRKLLYILEKEDFFSQNYRQTFIQTITYQTIAGALILNNWALVGSFLAVFGLLKAKSFYKSHKMLNSLVHRMLYDEKTNSLSVFLVKSIDNELKIKPESIEIKSSALGIDSQIEKMMGMDVSKDKDTRVFGINRLQMTFDALGETGEKIEGLKLIWSEDSSTSEDWEKMRELFK